MSSSHRNSFVSNSFFIFLIRFFPSLANFLVLVAYSNILPQSAYGDYQHFWIQLNVFYPLACFGIHIAIVTYSGEYLKNVLQRLTAKHYLEYSFWILSIAGVFALLQSQSLHLSPIIPFLFLLAFSLSFIFESILIVFRSYKPLVAVNVLYSLAYCLVHWLVIKSDFTLYAIFKSLLIVTSLRLIIYAALALHKIKNATISEQFAEGDELRRIRSLWLHLGIYDIIQILSGWIDKFIISILLTSQLSAIYFNGSQNIPFLPLLLGAASSAALIKLASGNKQDEKTDIIRIMNQSGRVLSCIVFPIFLFLLCYRWELIITVFTEKYAPAVPVFFAALFILPLRAYSFSTALQRLHKGAIINTGAVVEIVLGCLLMYPLYKWMGLPGVALSFVLSTWFQASFYLYHTAKLLNTSPWVLAPVKHWTYKLIVFATLFIGIHYIGISFLSQKISLFLGATVMAAAICISLFIELTNQRKHGRIQ